MEELTAEAKELVNLIENKEKMAAMLAPSFIIDFDFPDVVGMLKRLGFKYVVEVSRGAEETNKQLLALLKLHPGKKWITNPCPTVVRTIRNKYPHLIEYLAPIDSPMVATAKIINKKYPGVKKVFVGPCMLKKLEAKEDHPELDILALTYKDLAKIFEARKIKVKPADKKEDFDMKGSATRLYPISGGLAQSSGITSKFTDAEYDVISGPVLVDRTLQEFLNKPELKILDILNCEGGCINGPGIMSRATLEERRKKVAKYWECAKIKI